MSTHTYTQVDVFTDQPLHGNPLAVVHGADELSTEQMQRFAHWTNLSETTFLLRPNDPAADYRVRIFTPNRELPFAGHPTLGSCAAWLRAGGTPRVRGTVVQECGAGLVRIRQGANAPAFASPAATLEPVDAATLSAVMAALGVQPEQVRASQWMGIGPKWLGLLLDSAERVIALRPNLAALSAIADVGVVGPHPAGSEWQFELRAFAPADGINEDPVTGSLNAGVAQWLIGAGLAPARYLAAQGQCVGRAGRIHIEQEGRTTWVGGHSVCCIQGQVSL